MDEVADADVVVVTAMATEMATATETAMATRTVLTVFAATIPLAMVIADMGTVVSFHIPERREVEMEMAKEMVGKMMEPS